MMASDDRRSAPERHVVQTKRRLTVQRVLCITQVLGFPAEVVRTPLGVIFMTPAPLTQPERAGLLWFFFHLTPTELHEVARLHPTMDRIVHWHATYRCGHALVRQLERLRPPVIGLGRKRLEQFLVAESVERAEWVGRHYARDLLRTDLGLVLRQLEGHDEAECAHLQARLALWSVLMTEMATRQADRRKPLLRLDIANDPPDDLSPAVQAAT